MKKILVTGSTGFIGKSLVNNLLKDNNSIYAVIRKTKKNVKFSNKIKKNYKNYSSIFFKKNYELKLKLGKLNPDVVINLATNFIPNPNHKQLSSIIDSNVIFPTLVLDICCNKKILKFINLCSVAQCYKNKIDNPQNFYAMTKIMFKKSMSFYRKRNQDINFLNIYIGDTYGANDNRKKIFPTLLKNYIKNKRTTILTKKLKINIVHQEDIVNGIKILINKKVKSDDYRIKSKQNIILSKLINKFNLNNKKKIKVLWQNKNISTLNDIKMKKIPGWNERYSVEKSFCRDLNESN
jgi:nucleoside-diphosphate-sugar epimerase